MENTMYSTYRWIAIGLSSFLCVSGVIQAEEPTFRDVVYGSVGEVVLTLDFYETTQRRQERPLILWVHGGAWRSGNKSGVPILSLREQGFAIASVDYRLSPVAKFPAQIHDIKAATRYLKLHAERYNVDTDRFILAGASAGGHLAVLAAVTDGVTELSGAIGVNESASTRVQAVVSFYGASNLQTILAQSTPFGINMRVPALELLLGGVPEQQPALARLASPVEHIDPKDPPLWLFHGEQDPQMPISQSHELVGAYKKVGLPVKFDVVYGGKHGGSEFYSNERLLRLGKELLSLSVAER
jgi:acetyl esterase/lipase